MADNSHTVSLEDSPATILLASPAAKAEEVDPLADSPVLQWLLHCVYDTVSEKVRACVIHYSR